MTKIFQTKLPYISVCDTSLPQGLSEKKSEKKTITNKNFQIKYVTIWLVRISVPSIFCTDNFSLGENTNFTNINLQ